MKWHNEKRKLSELIPYEMNPRQLTVEQHKHLTASLKKFDLAEVPAINTDNTIVAGHQRTRILAELHGLDYEIDVRVPDKKLTKADFEEYLIRSNLNTGEFDMDVLSGFDEMKLLEWGFSEDELQFFTADEFIDGVTDEDDVPEVEESITKPGDLWLLGEHRVLCGDATISTDVEKLMGGDKWDVCIIDPPYDLPDLYGKAIPESSVGRKLVVMWDFKRFATAPLAAINAGWEPQYEFIWDCVQSWYTPNRPLARHKSIGVFGDDPFFDTNLAIIHDGKDRGDARTVRNTRGDCLYVPLVGAKHIATVEAFPNTQQTDEHGHGKPVKWIEAIYNGLGGEVYLDLFGGSGSSIIACEKSGRKCYTMELDPHYTDVIVKRWEEFTGKKATLSK